MPEGARIIEEVGVDVVGLVDFMDDIFKDGLELSFPDVMELVLQLRSQNQATVRDVIELRKLISNLFSDTHNMLEEITQWMMPLLHEEREGMASLKFALAGKGCEFAPTHGHGGYDGGEGHEPPVRASPRGKVQTAQPWNDAHNNFSNNQPPTNHPHSNPAADSVTTVLIPSPQQYESPFPTAVNSKEDASSRSLSPQRARNPVNSSPRGRLEAPSATRAGGNASNRSLSPQPWRGQVRTQKVTVPCGPGIPVKNDGFVECTVDMNMNSFVQQSPQTWLTPFDGEDDGK
jgi:hypothetical protein